MDILHRLQISENVKSQPERREMPFNEAKKPEPKHFLDLPKELRLQIYEYIIPTNGVSYHILSRRFLAHYNHYSHRNTTAGGPSSSHLFAPPHSEKSNTYAIAFVCKFISEEFIKHTYDTALFTFFVADTGVVDFTPWIVTRNVLNRIQHVAFAADLSQITLRPVTRVTGPSGEDWDYARYPLGSLLPLPDDGIERPDNLYKSLYISLRGLFVELPRLKTATSLLFMPPWLSDNDSYYYPANADGTVKDICCEYSISVEDYGMQGSKKWYCLLHG